MRKELATRHLSDFIRFGWRYVDPADYVHGWHIDAIAEHLEAVNLGQIRRLIINVPPRSSKSSLVSVAWPAWTWAQENDREFPLIGSRVQWLFASYGIKLSRRDNNKTRRLILSPWYQENWGDRFRLSYDVNTAERFDNDQGGYRMCTSVGGALTGEGGAIIVIDDPHKAGKDADSDDIRQRALDWWDQEMSTRLNDPRVGAFVVIAQRVHENDLCGHLLESNKWEHLMLPARFDERRRCFIEATKFEDPRAQDGDPLWPERFGVKELDDLESELGPYAAAAQLAQSPAPRGGGVFKRDWWQMYGQETDADNKLLAEQHLPLKTLKFPPFEYVVASVDTAFTEKEENDWSAMTVWGVFRDRGDLSKVMLAYAWQARLELNPLVERVAKTCKQWNVDRLLIEGKASGKSVIQELHRLYADEPWVVEEIIPEGDKVARAYSVQGIFSKGMILAPDRPYADLVINQMSSFPKAKHDDLVDSTVQAIRHLRDSGIIVMREERARELLAAQQHQAPLPPLYPA